MKKSKFCFSHNPSTRKQKKAAVIKGGKMSKKNRTSLPPIALNQPKDIVALLSTTINETRGGAIELRVANCIGYLSGHLIKAIEISDLETRLLKIEGVLNKDKNVF
ncbi:MAG: hypothetical protein M0Q12_05605 [Synergistaceae bacterium]|jgi:hypothetical protein|nr:hypothetical protein [Synergistaceae bacterium]